MGNKIYKYIIITEILLILAVFGPLFLGQVNVLLTESVERYSNDVLHHVATLTMPFGLLYELDSFTHVPMQYTNGSLVDVFVTPVVFLLCCSMWCGIVYWLVNIIRKKQAPAITSDKDAFWKKIFLSNLLISLVSLVFIFLISQHNQEGDTGDNFFLYMIVLMLTITCSLLLAAAWWLAEKLWYRNRLFSIIIASTTGITALVVIFLAMQLVITTDRPALYSEEQLQAVSAAVDAAAPAGEVIVADTAATVENNDHSTPGTSIGPEYMIDAADYILRQQLEVDSSVAKHQQTYELADKWHNYVYPLYAPPGGNPRATLAYAKNQGLDALIDQMNYVGRSGSRLQESFTLYKDLLWKALPYKTYQTSIARYYVEKLLHTYTVLQAEGAPATRLKKLYTKMADTTDYHETESFIGDVMPLVGNINRIDPALNNNDINAQRTAVWLISFWARRYHEGNQEEVHDILKGIQVMYDGK
jgi:hypothetical protein